MSDDEVWESHEWEFMIQRVTSIHSGVLRDLKGVLTAQVREARTPRDMLYNPFHFILLVSTPWENGTLKTLVNTWTHDELNFKVPLSKDSPESSWKIWCRRALAQLSFEDLRKVSVKAGKERTRMVTTSEYLFSQSLS